MTTQTSVDLSDLLISSAKEVLETMIFMSLEKCADETQPIGENIMGTITFTGQIQGCIGLCCSMACAKSIAANMMGMDGASTLSSDEIADAVGEVVNMIMGSFKSRILPISNNIDVSVPSVIGGVNLDSISTDGHSKAVIVVAIDEHPARLILLAKSKK